MDKDRIDFNEVYKRHKNDHLGNKKEKNSKFRNLVTVSVIMATLAVIHFTVQHQMEKALKPLEEKILKAILPSDSTSSTASQEQVKEASSKPDSVKLQGQSDSTLNCPKPAPQDVLKKGEHRTKLDVFFKRRTTPTIALEKRPVYSGRRNVGSC